MAGIPMSSLDRRNPVRFPRQLPRQLVWMTGLLVAACTSETTQLVVVVDSDYDEEELAEIRVEVTHAGGSLGTRRFELAQLDLPLSFGVVPPSGDATRPVTVTARALNAGSTELSTRRAVTWFVKNKTLLLPIFLARSCRNIACSTAFTCTEDGCRSPDVDPSILSEVEPGAEGAYPFPNTPDGGVTAPEGRDAGTDGGSPNPDRDAGPSDVGSPVGVRMGIIQTSGGAVLMSPTHRLSVQVGAPQPMGEKSSGTHTLRLEAE